MHTATLIVATLGSLSLAAPASAQQHGRPARGAAPGATYARPAMPSTSIAPSPAATAQPVVPLSVRSPRGDWRPGRPGDIRHARPIAQRPGWRWGEKIDGRWAAGSRAPGGWDAYRRPVRGWTLPGYWTGGGFWLSDWGNWGLSNPPHGYNWVRYYDDAVLVDQYGRVWDSVGNVDWDRGDGYADEDYEFDADDGDYGADYDAPDYADAPPPAYAPPPVVTYGRPGRSHRCIASCHHAPAYGYGYGYGAPVTTTVVIQSAPVATTTTVTEEVVYDGGHKVVRRVPIKQLYRAPARVKTKTLYRR